MFSLNPCVFMDLYEGLSVTVRGPRVLEGGNEHFDVRLLTL
jgi:hypothetical protein